MNRRRFLARPGMAAVALRTDAHPVVAAAIQSAGARPPEVSAADENFWMQVRASRSSHASRCPGVGHRAARHDAPCRLGRKGADSLRGSDNYTWTCEGHVCMVAPLIKSSAKAYLATAVMAAAALLGSQIKVPLCSAYVVGSREGGCAA